MNWRKKASKLPVVSNDSIKAVGAEPRIQIWEPMPRLLPQRPTLSEEPELEIRQAEHLNRPTVHCHPLNHTPFPPFFQVWALQVLYVTYISCKKRGGYGKTAIGGKILNDCGQVSQTSASRYIRCRVTVSLKPQAPCFNLGFEWRILQSPYYCFVSVCQQRDRAGLDNRQDRTKVILTRWNRLSECNVSHFSQLLTQGLLLFLSLTSFSHSHQSGLFFPFFPFLLSFLWTWPHISPDACCDRPTIPDTHPSRLQIPFTTKNWTVGSTFTHRPLLIHRNERFRDSFRVQACKACHLDEQGCCVHSVAILVHPSAGDGQLSCHD